jgi:hypothetical protein
MEIPLSGPKHFDTTTGNHELTNRNYPRFPQGYPRLCGWFDNATNHRCGGWRRAGLSLGRKCLILVLELPQWSACEACSRDSE